MSLEMLALLATIGFVLVCVLAIFWLRVPRKLKPDYFASKWQELQSYCRNKETWPEALVEADKLLDNALKKRKLKGGSMGERLVSAQKMFSDNDGVWFAHNLCKKVLEHNPKIQLKESNVKDALVGFRQALRDLGALSDSAQAKQLKVKK